MADSYDPTLVAGDTLRWTMAVSGVTGASYNFTGCTLNMQIRKGYYPGKTYLNYTLYVSGSNTFYIPEGFTGGLSTTATGGMVAVTIGSNYTKNFVPYTPVFYDMQVQTSNPQGYETFLRGSITVLPEVTRG
jgi:hypothetical protein